MGRRFDRCSGRAYVEAVECAVNSDGEAAVFLEELPGAPRQFLAEDRGTLIIVSAGGRRRISVAPACAAAAKAKGRILVVEFCTGRLRRETWIPRRTTVRR